MIRLLSFLLLCGIVQGQSTQPVTQSITFCRADWDAAVIHLKDEGYQPESLARVHGNDSACLDRMVSFRAEIAASGEWRIISKCCENEKPEPVDVPAIQEKLPPGYYSCEHWHSVAPDSIFISCDDPPHPPEYEWTCADKSRILLQSVDGSVHVCHRAQMEAKP